MAKMSKAKELRAMTLEALYDESDDLRRKLFDLRFQHYTGQLVDTATLRLTRRSVARLETVIRERQMAQTEAAQTEAEG